jgi:hypothetical protein
MELHVCECGDTPRIVFNIEGKSLITVSCPECLSTTPRYEELKDAISMWNTWCWKLEYSLALDAIK